MIDKLWYDWQHRSLSNKHLFSGGSVSYQANASELFSVYPTGGPPWLDVRYELDLRFVIVIQMLTLD